MAEDRVSVIQALVFEMEEKLKITQDDIRAAEAANIAVVAGAQQFTQEQWQALEVLSTKLGPALSRSPSYGGR